MTEKKYKKIKIFITYGFPYNIYNIFKDSFCGSSIKTSERVRKLKHEYEWSSCGIFD